MFNKYFFEINWIKLLKISDKVGQKGNIREI